MATKPISIEIDAYELLVRERKDPETVLPGWVRTAMAERAAKTESERRGITVEQVWAERAALYARKRDTAALH
jgi:hypothetical protein